jgi:hypothetical protein
MIAENKIRPSYANVCACPLVTNLSGLPNATRNMQRLMYPHPLFLSFYTVTTQYQDRAQRTETPDLLVNILDAMFIDASSWKSSLAA